VRTSDEFWVDMKSSNAVWEHPGHARAPHVRLRNGCCSDGFIDTLQYLSDTVNLSLASDAMAVKLNAELGGRTVTWVFGSPMAGIPFATLVGVKMGVPRVGVTEKTGNNKDQICRFDLASGATFIDVEEMTTSGETPQRVIDAVIKKNPGAESAPFIGALLIRCERRPAALLGKEIVPLIDLPELGVKYHEWGIECPLCKAGSRVVTNVKKVWFDFLRTMKDPAYMIPGAEYAEPRIQN
jgi:orotate phosphoribosyltransferase